MLHLSIET